MYVRGLYSFAVKNYIVERSETLITWSAFCYTVTLL